ncbi:MAG: fructosamine kinase family protein [Balneolaceae bacterium]|nr:fructosamine kinase family protein [Balneolaceae bacterium]
MPDEALKQHIENKLGQSIRSSRSASGGSINRAAVIELEQEGRCFLQWNRSADPEMFAREVEGLRRLSDAGTDLIVPDVIDQGVAGEDTGYLLMEYVEEGSPGSTSSGAFGRSLAALHRNSSENEQYGLDHDNFIGKLPQSNDWHENWVDFFVEERMEPQLEMALQSGRLSPGIRKAFQQMYRRLPDIFPDEPPSLLHGDLWGGNYFFDSEGRAAVYDPAVYYGHREIELAFTHLFGGFSSGFYSAYDEAWPIEPGFEGRKEIYNLYPLLVHTNLFGGHYGSRVQSIVRQFR